MDLCRREAEDFLTDAGISKGHMRHLIPDQYKVLLTPSAHIDKISATVHETMRIAYGEFQNIDRESIY